MNRKVVKNSIYFEIVETELKQGKDVLIPIRGNSMLPFFKDSQRIAIKPFVKSKISKGDVIIARWNGQVILHRLVHRKHNQLHLAGDNNLGLIEKVSEGDVIGVAKGYYNKKNIFKNITIIDRSVGLLWFYLRPLRIIYKKIIK